VSLGGGPGFELLATDWFLRYWAAVGDAPLEEREDWMHQARFEAQELSAHATALAAAAAAAAAGAGSSRELAAEARDAQEDAEAAAAVAAEVEAQAGAGKPPRMEFASLDLQARPPSTNIFLHEKPPLP
jgi:hypothetical protein